MRLQEDAPASEVQERQRDLQHLSSALDAFTHLQRRVTRYKERVVSVRHFYHKFKPAMIQELDASTASRVAALRQTLQRARCDGVLIDASHDAASYRVEVVKLQGELQDLRDDASKLEGTQRVLEVCLCLSFTHCVSPAV